MPTERLFTNAFFHSSIGMALVSPEGRWLRVNPALCEMLGYETQEFLSKTFQDITFEEDLGGDLAALQDCLDGKRSTYTIEKRYFHKDGHLVWAHLTVSAVRDQEGEVSFFISQLQDISQSKKDQEQLVSSSKMATLGNLAAGISHEINNPLTVIEGNASILMNEAHKLGLEQSTFLKRLELISKTVEKIGKIVEGMKNYARDSKSEDNENVKLDYILDETLSLCRARLNKSNISIKFDVAPNTLIHCNRISLTQILLNLISNSIDALESVDNKRILISAKESEDDSVEISVSDNGHGIDEKNKTKIMNQFFTTKKYGKGTGLGLSLSKELAQMMSGDLELVDDASQTTFKVTIPKARKAKTEAA